MAEPERLQLKHPEAGKAAPRIARDKYEAVRRAILAAVGEQEGLPFKDLAAQVEARLPRETLAALGSVGWYTTSVKLDLEARGEIERMPGSRPQRLRLANK